MSEKNTYVVSEELLYKYFLEEASSQEQERVLHWKALKEDNRLAFERAKIFMLDAKALNHPDDHGQAYDVDQAWAKFSRPIRMKDKNRMDRFNDFLKVAAVLVLMIGVGWFADNQIHQNETFALVSQVGTKKADLADGSIVTLNQNSELVYTAGFGDGERRVTLQGEAYFEVKRMTDQPFVVESGEVEVRVLGTSFNVNHSNEDSLVVTVDSGRVRMGVADQEEILTAGFTGIYYHKTRRLIKIRADHSGMHNYWRAKSLSFTDAPLTAVLGAIRTVYGSRVKLSHKAILDCRITVDLENQPIEQALNVIGKRLNLVWSKKGNYYLLAGKGCSL